MRTYTLFVGADNATGVVAIESLKVILDSRHEGYTIVPTVGRWQGKDEQSVIVIISTDDELAVNRTISDIKINLSQQSVGLQKSEPIEFL